ncbi:MAG: MraY family glycosyltransferase [Patescibacteria group bacterium]
MFYTYLIYFLAALASSILFTIVVRRLALRFQIVDVPDQQRKKHFGPTPLLGGVAIFISFSLVVGFLLLNPIYGIEIFKNKLIWIAAAGLILIIMGAVDDAKQLSPQFRLLITALAALVAVIGGVGLEKITNPFGGIINFGLIVGGIFAFLWLMGMMYTTKILDGLDGLSTGIVFIGALMIFFLTNTKTFFQPNVGLLAIIFAGSCLGFLIFNFNPAKIFLGEGGSLFIGFILGILAIISGGKVATALLVMAIPILDLIRVAVARIRRKQSIFKGDREHLHFRLMDAGWSHKQSVLLMYALAFIFGITTLLFQSQQKLFALVFLVLLMAYVTIKTS